MWWRLGHWPTVDAMLEDLSPVEFAEARAAYELIPLADGWKQTDTLCGEIKEEFASFFAMKAGKRSVPQNWRFKTGDFIPKLKFVRDQEIHVNQQSIDAFQVLIENRFKQQ